MVKNIIRRVGHSHKLLSAIKPLSNQLVPMSYYNIMNAIERKLRRDLELNRFRDNIIYLKENIENKILYNKSHSIVTKHEQIPGLIGLPGKLRQYLNDYNPTKKEDQEVHEYLTKKLCQALYTFNGDIPDEHAFLGKIMQSFGDIKRPMPRILEKYFGPIALSQHNANILAAYRKYPRTILDDFNKGSINTKTLDELLFQQQFIEQGVVFVVMGEILQENPKIVVYAVNPEKTHLIPGYDKKTAMEICEQPHIDYCYEIPSDMKNMVMYILKYQDVKSSGLHAMSYGRITLTQGLYNWGYQKTKQFMNNYRSELQAKVLALKLPKNMKQHPYKKLLSDLNQVFLETNSTNTSSSLDAFLLVLKTAYVNPDYKDLHISLTADAGIDKSYQDLLDSCLEERITASPEKIFASNVFFPEGAMADENEITYEVRKLIKLFPEEQQQSIWENFDRFGAPNNYITEK